MEVGTVEKPVVPTSRSAAGFDVVAHLDVEAVECP
jgi:hypothetical protein